MSGVSIGPQSDVDARSQSNAGVLAHVQGLRAVAVIFVLLYHAGAPLPGGFTGVDMFFVISGYVITLVLVREFRTSGTIRLTRFYARRFKRLTPALAVVVAVTTAFSLLLLSPLGPQETTAQTGLGAMLLIANVVIARTTGDYFDAPAETNALLHTWSLSVEEQFYLVFPVFLLLSLRFFRARSVTVGLLALAAAVSGTLAILGSRGRDTGFPESLVGFYGPATRAWEFAVGALLALVLSRALPLRRFHRAFGAAGLLLVVASGAVIDASTPLPSEWAVLPVLGTALLIVAAPGWPRLDRVLASRHLVWIGDRSYSLYLWHWPFVVFAVASFPDSAIAAYVGVALSIVPAVLSFNLVEQPMRRMPAPRGRRLVRLIVATVLPVLVITGSVATAAAKSFGSERLRELQAAAEEITPGCHDYVALQQNSVESCTWNEAGAGSPIYVLGDSHAKHLTTGLVEAAGSLNRPVVISTAPECPLMNVVIDMDGDSPSRDADCRRFVEGTLEFLNGAEIGTVILSASDLYWWDPEIAVGLSSAGLTSRTSEKLGLAGAALTRTVETIKDSGHHVLLVQDVPRWAETDAWDPTHCTGLQLIRDDMTCRREMPIDRVSDRQGGVRPIIASVARETDSTVVDTWPLLCPSGVCRTWAGTMTTYRDSNHISIQQSAALAPMWVDELGLEPGDDSDDAST